METITLFVQAVTSQQRCEEKGVQLEQNQPLCYRAFSLSPKSPENSPVTLHVITRNHSPFTHNKTIQICEQRNSKIFGGWLLEMFFDLVKDYRVFLRHSGPSEIPCSIEVGACSVGIGGKGHLCPPRNLRIGKSVGVPLWTSDRPLW